MTDEVKVVRSHVMQKPGWAGELSDMMAAYEQAGGDPSALQLPEVATLVISANQILASHEIEGVHFEAEETEHGVRAHIQVDPQAQIAKPVHLCFGLLPAEGLQEIEAWYEIGAGAKVDFLAHCSFPNAVKVEHHMDAQIYVGAGAQMKYTEEHYHGAQGGVQVLPRAAVQVEKDGQFSTTFSLTRGRIGELEIDYGVQAGENAVVELTTKAFGSQDDRVTVREAVHLNGKGARGLTKTRVAVRDQASSQVFTTMEGNAPEARGHMDCTEIVRNQAVATNTPLVIVRDDQAQVTHEAAIGTVNRHELETLMARGLDEDEAVDLIIRGVVR